MKTKKFTILHSNDMHGDFLAEMKAGRKELMGGLSLLSGYINENIHIMDVLHIYGLSDHAYIQNVDEKVCTFRYQWFIWSFQVMSMSSVIMSRLQYPTSSSARRRKAATTPETLKIRP